MDFFTGFILVVSFACICIGGAALAIFMFNDEGENDDNEVHP